MDERRASLTGKRFLLGLGAQKAGTTWLYHYLAAHQNVRLGRHKEYHVWDALDVPYARQRYGRGLRLLSSRDQRLRFLLRHVPGLYFIYFARLLSQRGVNLTADLTPLYSALGIDRLRSIRDGFVSRKIECVAVFLMREPVERCRSVVGMWKRRLSEGEKPPDKSFLNLRTYYSSEHAATFTDYSGTLERMQKVFPAEESYIGLYEEMFTDRGIGDLSKFLSVSPVPSMADRKYNASARQDGVDAELFRDAARFHRKAYEAAADRLPAVRDLWRGFQYL